MVCTRCTLDTQRYWSDLTCRAYQCCPVRGSLRQKCSFLQGLSYWPTCKWQNRWVNIWCLGKDCWECQLFCINKLKVVNNNVGGQNFNRRKHLKKEEKRSTAKIKSIAETRDYSELVGTLRIWTRDLQIFSLTLSQLSYLGNTHSTLNYHLSRSFHMSFIKTKQKPLVTWFFLPSKVQKEFLKALCQKDSIFLPSPPGQLIDSVAGQRVYWWIDVTKCKLISGNLSVWRHVSLAEEK